MNEEGARRRSTAPGEHLPRQMSIRHHKMSLFRPPGVQTPESHTRGSRRASYACSWMRTSENTSLANFAERFFYDVGECLGLTLGRLPRLVAGEEAVCSLRCRAVGSIGFRGRARKVCGLSHDQ
jgi:hypothetical protein